MKIYSHYGFNDFVILGGYKQEMIKKYFQDYFFSNCDVTFNYQSEEYSHYIHNNNCEKWNVTVLDTGLESLTAERLRRARHIIGDEPFLLTYGDGVSNVDILKSIEQHKKSGALVTLTAFQPEQKFGTIEFAKGSDTLTKVSCFKEKVKDPDTWINAGFFVVEPKALDYIKSDCYWEGEPLAQIAKEGGLHAYKHSGFWMCMDTLKDKTDLEKIWSSGKAPWKLWK